MKRVGEREYSGGGCPRGVASVGEGMQQSEAATSIPAAARMPDERWMVRAARRAGQGLGCFLALFGFARLFLVEMDPGTWSWLRAGFYTVFGIALTLPWNRFGTNAWRRGMFLLAVATVAFAFSLVIDSLFDMIAMAETGRKPGLPAFQGTLIFLALMQVPAILFERRPELLE